MWGVVQVRWDWRCWQDYVRSCCLGLDRGRGHSFGRRQVLRQMRRLGDAKQERGSKSRSLPSTAAARPRCFRATTHGAWDSTLRTPPLSTLPAPLPPLPAALRSAVADFRLRVRTLALPSSSCADFVQLPHLSLAELLQEHERQDQQSGSDGGCLGRFDIIVILLTCLVLTWIACRWKCATLNLM